MLCDICHKEEAVVFYTLVIGGKKIKLALCAKCAAKKGLLAIPLKKDLSPESLLSGTSTDGDNIRCQRCGLTYREFTKNFKFGCGECYNSFRDRIIPLLRRIHGASQHTGKERKKLNQGAKKEKKILELKRRLKEAIEKERYEDAAKLRDEIKETKNAI
jgi:protein arginine kinase activator